MIMKHSIFLIITVWVSALFVSCSEERLAEHVASPDFEEGELVLVPLGLSVNSFEVGVQTSGSRAPEEEELAGSAEENAVHNLWVFQFDDSENQLINPRYYTIADQSELENLEVKVWLKPGVSSTVYVVTNTDQPNWITEQTDVSTIAQLQSLELYNLDPQFVGKVDTLSIPMQGDRQGVIVSENSKITIPVTRMFAKLKVKIQIEREDMILNDLYLVSAPKVCRVVARTGENGDVTDYKTGFEYWRTETFNLSKKDDTYIVYTAENMQGIIESESDIKNDFAPSKALRLTARMRLDEEGESLIPYRVYPGGNKRNDFNIRRNCIYNVTIIITKNADLHAPSSNCFIVEPGDLLSFEPYYRVETGGGYKIEDYLNPDDESGKKVISSVKILWQTENAIGNNEEEQLVWYNKDQQKIYVKTKQEGNALIAAYNKDNEIIWSWHIWITGIHPDQTSITYKTYTWDKTQIYGKDSGRKRTTGYDVMTCNLGALASEPETAQDTKPFGMLYQWGRKDPFPPFIKGIYSDGAYNDTNTGMHYDNSHDLVGKTNEYDPTKLFHSYSGTDMVNLDNPILYAIQHPTVFMCGTWSAIDPHERYVYDIENYAANGDWTDQHDDKLWGGLEPDETMESFEVVKDRAHIYRNYGDKKSIFDPCPYGWRVPPGDLWLGFTSTGVNPKSNAEINYIGTVPGWSMNSSYWGMYIYLEDWKTGSYSYFPNQGTRVGSGYGMRVGSCGNYHNATADEDDRVNILHIHNDWQYFHVFETQYLMYYVKSVAGPIRCVRDPNLGQ